MNLLKSTRAGDRRSWMFQTVSPSLEVKSAHTVPDRSVGGR
jgi:hypothetical protein